MFALAALEGTIGVPLVVSVISEFRDYLHAFVVDLENIVGSVFDSQIECSPSFFRPFEYSSARTSSMLRVSGWFCVSEGISVAGGFVGCRFRVGSRVAMVSALWSLVCQECRSPRDSCCLQHRHRT